MLLQQKGYPAGPPRAARAGRGIPGHLPGSHRQATGANAARLAGRRHCGCGPTISEYTVTDLLHGVYTGVVDDLVLRRGDGVAAYNLAVVVDDAAQGVDQVVRGDDLLASSPRQAYLGALLGYPQPVYAHVPLVLNADGKRLAKRDGAVTLAEIGVPTALLRIANSLGYTTGLIDEMLNGFDPARLPRDPWIYPPSVGL